MEFNRLLTQLYSSLEFIQTYCVEPDSFQTFKTYRNELALIAPKPKVAFLQQQWDAFIVELYADRNQNLKTNNLFTKNILQILVNTSSISELLSAGSEDINMASELIANVHFITQTHSSLATCTFFWVMYTCLEEIIRPVVDKLSTYSTHEELNGFGSFKDKTIEALQFLSLLNTTKIQGFSTPVVLDDPRTAINQTFDYISTHLKAVANNLKFLEESTAFQNKGFQVFCARNHAQFAHLLRLLADNTVVCGLDSKLDKDVLNTLWYILLNERIAHRALGYNTNGFLLFLYALFKKSLELDFVSIDVKNHQLTSYLLFDIMKLLQQILSENPSGSPVFDAALYIFLKEEILVLYRDTKLLKQSKNAFSRLKYLTSLLINHNFTDTIESCKKELLKNLNKKFRFSGS